MQNALLSPKLASTDHLEWMAIFSKVLFPLISDLLKPEIYQTDPVGMSQTRLQAPNLLCKIFLHYLDSLSKWDGMLDLWLDILDIMDRLMNSGQGDNLEEAVPESLKNILLVMANSKILAPPSSGEQPSELWIETGKRVDRFLPDLMTELFPEAKAPPPADSAASLSSVDMKTPASSIMETGERPAEDHPSPGQAVTEQAAAPQVETTREDGD